MWRKVRENLEQKDIKDFIFAIIGIIIVAAEEMGCFEKIAFVDDERKATPNGLEVIGTVRDIDELAIEYRNIIVAIGDPGVRLGFLKRIKEETPFYVASMVSPRAYISPSAQIMWGCIIEPMAVVHTGCLISAGGIISAGVVVNHYSVCSEGVHIDCNAVVTGYSLVPAGIKVNCGEVYGRKDAVKAENLFFNLQK